MSVGQQVCVIYTGVRGYLDSIKPEEVVDFEEKFNEHITTAQAGNYFVSDNLIGRLNILW